MDLFWWRRWKFDGMVRTALLIQYCVPASPVPSRPIAIGRDSRLPKPLRVLQVGGGDPFDGVCALFRSEYFDLFRGYACVHAVGLAAHTYGYDGTRSDNDVALHYGVVHYDGPHTDEYAIVHGTSVYDSAVSDTYVVADKVVADRS